MKKRCNSLIASVLIIIVMLAGCSSSDSATESISYKEAATEYKAVPAAEEAVYDFEVGGGFGSDTSAMSATEDMHPSAELPGNTVDTAGSSVDRKLIKRVNMDIETLEFEESVAQIEKNISLFGGYIESSSVSNSNYYETRNNSKSARRANYVLRIPGQMLDAFLAQVGDIGNIVNQSMTTQDITLEYVDLKARTESLEIQQERLLDLLEKAETVEDIISLEDRLSTVRYQIESQKSILKNYDNLVDFSTVTIELSEVIRITSPEPTTTGERISSGISDTFYDIGVGLENFAVRFLVNLPYIFIWAVIIAAAIFVIIRGKKVVKKHKERKEAKLQDEWDEKQKANAQSQDLTSATSKSDENV